MKHLYLRIRDEAVYEAVVALARLQKRSINQMAELLLAKAVKDEQAKE